METKCDPKINASHFLPANRGHWNKYQNACL